MPGQKVDRFGSESGRYLAPLGAPYIERGLPPSSLRTFDGMYPFGYHVYEVLREFVVTAGPVRAWFGQPGMGTQFLADTSVEELVEDGFLLRLSRSEYDERVEFADGYSPGPDAA